jgi:hypothetical protein
MAFFPSESRAGFALGAASGYAVLVDANTNDFQMTSNSSVTGNVGIGSPITAVGLAGGTITGNLDFSGAAPSGGPNFGGTVGGTTSTNVSAVSTALSVASSLNTVLGAEAGTSLTVSGSGQVINASAGTLDGSGNRVFTVAANAFNNNFTGITINGTSSDFVVINILNGTTNENLGGAVKLTGGITSDQVLFNFVGTSGNLSSGPTNNAIVNGVWLAPNMKINVDSVTITGRLFGGRSGQDYSIVSNAFVIQPTAALDPEPSTISLLGVGSFGLLASVWLKRKSAKK